MTVWLERTNRSFQRYIIKFLVRTHDPLKTEQILRRRCLTRRGSIQKTIREKDDSMLSPVPLPHLLACHGEDADNQVDAPVAQQRHLRFIPLALLGFLLGLDGSPDADPEDQQVEEHHNGHAGDVERHDGAARFRVKDRACAGRLDDTAYPSLLLLLLQKESCRKCSEAQWRRLELHITRSSHPSR